MKIAILLILLLPAVASARIGEARAQIDARVGMAREEDSQSVYSKGEFTIVVKYDRGISVIEKVSKSAPGTHGITHNVDLTEKEISALLTLYGDGRNWHKQESAHPAAWKRSDGKVAATYQRDSPALVFADTAFTASLRTEKEREERTVENVRSATPGPTAAQIGSHTPVAPYPAAARVAHITGSGVCHVRFNAAGRVASASMSRSTGNYILDRNTVEFARANWTGQPNSSGYVPITYRLK